MLNNKFNKTKKRNYKHNCRQAGCWTARIKASEEVVDCPNFVRKYELSIPADKFKRRYNELFVN